MIAPTPPPHSKEAERSVLGCVLIDPRMIDQVAPFLKPEHFFDDLNGGTYALMLEHRDAKTPITIQALDATLKHRFPTEDISPYLYDLARLCPLATQAPYYAKKVRDFAKRRNWMVMAEKLLADAKDMSNDLSTIDAKADHYCREGLEYAADTKAATVGDGLKSLAQQIRDGKYAQRPGVSTGMDALDRCTGGLKPGQLITLAAPTGGNKSGFALSRLLEISTSTQRPTLYFSLEMLESEVEERALANLAKVPTSRFSSPTEDDSIRVDQAAELYSDLPLFVVDKSMIRVSEIAAIARSMHWQHNFAAIVVDYVQLVEADFPKEARHQQVGRVTRVLKTLAMDLQVPIIALAQLNREYKGGKPTLAMLRESGSIEQDSNMVWFLWPEEIPGSQGDDFRWDSKPPKEDDTPNDMEKITLTVAKNRSGPVGADIKLFVKKGQFRYFTEADAHTQSKAGEMQFFDKWNNQGNQEQF